MSRSRTRTKCGAKLSKDNPNLEYNSEQEGNTYRLRLIFNSLKICLHFKFNFNNNNKKVTYVQLSNRSVTLNFVQVLW